LNYNHVGFGNQEFEGGKKNCEDDLKHGTEARARVVEGRKTDNEGERNV
jgi:hypothetical protein